MSIDGEWKIIIKSPMGAMPSVLSLKNEGGVVTGMQSGQGQTSPIGDGKLDGDALTWTNAVTSPMAMTFEFSAKIEGDKIAGKVKAGAFGQFPFEGGRV